MSEDKSISLVNLGKLSKPADTLIKKVSSAIGWIFEPWQLERVAKGKAKVELIEAQSRIEINELEYRALRRLAVAKGKYQENIEEITKKATSKLEEKADPNRMDDDWITNFFDKSRLISDNQMQDLWASVLAGEANSPGTYSRRTVNFLENLDKEEAVLFTTLCRFSFKFNESIPLIFDVTASIYNDNNINLSTLHHLDSIGLITFENFSGFTKPCQSTIGSTPYYGEVLQLKMKEDMKINVGKVLFTQTGIELSSICQSPSVAGFFDYVKEQWKEHIPSNEKS